MLLHQRFTNALNHKAMDRKRNWMTGILTESLLINPFYLVMKWWGGFNLFGKIAIWPIVFVGLLTPCCALWILYMGLIATGICLLSALALAVGIPTLIFCAIFIKNPFEIFKRV